MKIGIWLIHCLDPADLFAKAEIQFYLEVAVSTNEQGRTP